MCETLNICTLLTLHACASVSDDKDTAVLLEERGARLNDKDKEGHTGN